MRHLRTVSTVRRFAGRSGPGNVEEFRGPAGVQTAVSGQVGGNSQPPPAEEEGDTRIM